jgi:hypothetical protein
MGKYLTRLAMLVLIASAVLTEPLHAITGQVRAAFAKAGLIAGAGLGRGVLTFRGRSYPFRVSGLSVGFTAGASVVRLTGSASYLNELSDFPGIYSSVGVGGALGWWRWRGPVRKIVIAEIPAEYV